MSEAVPGGAPDTGSGLVEFEGLIEESLDALRLTAAFR
jgi:hypothetical protein